MAGVRVAAQEEEVAALVRVIGFDCNPQLLCTRADGTYWPELHTSFHEEVVAQGVLLPWTSITSAHGDEELTLTLEAVRAGIQKVRAAVDDGSVDSSFEGDPVRPVFRHYNRCLQSHCGRLYRPPPRWIAVRTERGCVALHRCGDPRP